MVWGHDRITAEGMITVINNSFNMRNTREYCIKTDLIFYLFKAALINFLKLAIEEKKKWL